MSIRFDGNQALVTGAGKGIGRNIAIRLAEAGAEVIAISRTAADLQSLREQIGCRTMEADLTDPYAARQAAEDAGDVQLGRFAKPSNVSDAVLYLLSDHADMITGATLPVDGGFLAT